MNDEKKIYLTREELREQGDQMLEVASKLKDAMREALVETAKTEDHKGYPYAMIVACASLTGAMVRDTATVMGLSPIFVLQDVQKLILAEMLAAEEAERKKTLH